MLNIHSDASLVLGRVGACLANKRAVNMTARLEFELLDICTLVRSTLRPSCICTAGGAGPRRRWANAISGIACANLVDKPVEYELLHFPSCSS